MAEFQLSMLANKVAAGRGGLAGLEWEGGKGESSTDSQTEEGEDVTDGGVGESKKKMVRSYNELKQKGTMANGGQGTYYPGLLNAAGNLCFLNATLQSMASTPSLLSHLHRTLHLSSTISPPFPVPVTKTLLLTLSALNTPSSRPAAPLRPLELARALADSSPSRRRLMASSEQQDAHELWGMIRDACEEESVKLEKALSTNTDGGLAELLNLGGGNGAWGGGGEKKGKEKERVGKDPYLHLVGQRASCTLADLLQETFGKTDVISDYSCRKCSLLATHEKLLAQRDRLALSPTVPPPADPSLSNNSFASIPTDTAGGLPKAEAKMTKSRNDRKKKVQKLVDKVQEVIEMMDFEKELGEEIKVERVEGPAGKLVRFARSPDILTFHVNRSTHYGRGGAYKNTCLVTFPEYFDLTPYCDMPSSSSSPNSYPNDSNAASDSSPPLNESRDLFRLSSLVVHYGTHSFGHYVAFRRRPRPPPSSFSPFVPVEEEDGTKPEWYRVSDETVEPARLADVLRANPFLLFYERVGGERSGVGMEELGGERNQEGLVKKVVGRIVPRLVESWMLASPAEGAGV